MVKYIVHFVSNTGHQYVTAAILIQLIQLQRGLEMEQHSLRLPFHFVLEKTSLSVIFLSFKIVILLKEETWISHPSKLPVFQKTNNWSLWRAFVAFCPTSIMDKTNILEYQTYSMLYKALTKVNEDYLALRTY